MYIYNQCDLEPTFSTATNLFDVVVQHFCMSSTPAVRKRKRVELKKEDIPVIKEEKKNRVKPKRKKQKLTPVLVEEQTWTGWHDIYFIGTEWENYESVFQKNWNFDHLKEKVYDGDLAQGKITYLFGATERM